VSPILIRPIREQLQHDRVVREVQARWRRRFSIEINPGQEENASVKAGSKRVFPDLVLTSKAGGRRLHGIVEVETIESVNHLEAMSEWAELARVRGAFYLYVPAGRADVTRKLCENNNIVFAEIWTFYSVGRETRFSLVHQSKSGIRSSKARKATEQRLRAESKKNPISQEATHAKKTKKSVRPSGKAKAGAKTAKPKTGVRSVKKRTNEKSSREVVKSPRTRSAVKKVVVTKSSVKPKKATKGRSSQSAANTVKKSGVVQSRATRKSVSSSKSGNRSKTTAAKELATKRVAPRRANLKRGS